MQQARRLKTQQTAIAINDDATSAVGFSGQSDAAGATTRFETGQCLRPPLTTLFSSEEAHRLFLSFLLA